MNDPAKIILGALRVIESEQDHLHRETMLDAVEDELRRIRGGCRCERRLHMATSLENDRGEAARMLMRIAHRNLQAIAECRCSRDGMAEGLAVIAEMAGRLAGEMDEHDN